MANTPEEMKKPSVYGGEYDTRINELAQQYAERPDFQYNVNQDALYQQYKDRYTQNAKRSMKDTMGQAATLTGGYGSTYGQMVGQQAYDETMRGLTDKIPELEGRAYERYNQQGQDILNQYNLMNQLGAADQQTRQYQQEWDFNQQKYADQQGQYADAQKQQAYQNLSNAILTSGYIPNPDELAAAGMTEEQANAFKQAWVGANPDIAWYTGAITAEDYFKLTGKNPPGVGGGGSGYGGSKKKKSTKDEVSPSAPIMGAALGFVGANPSVQEYIKAAKMSK